MRPTQADRNVVFISPEGETSTKAIDNIVLTVIARIADKWTMCVLEVLEQNGVVRFGRIADLVGGISQRMLTKTLRQMEADGLVIRTVFPEVPPRVEYELTERGLSLCGALCSVWRWAEAHRAEFEDPETARRSARAAGERAVGGSACHLPETTHPETAE